jgi:hypothetical protein
MHKVQQVLQRRAGARLHRAAAGGEEAVRMAAAVARRDFGGSEDRTEVRQGEDDGNVLKRERSCGIRNFKMSFVHADRIIRKLARLVAHYGYKEEMPNLRSRERKSFLGTRPKLRA